MELYYNYEHVSYDFSDPLSDLISITGTVTFKHILTLILHLMAPRNCNRNLALP